MDKKLHPPSRSSSSRNAVAFAPGEHLALYLAIYFESRGIPAMIAVPNPAAIIPEIIGVIESLGCDVVRGVPETFPLDGLRAVYLHTFDRSLAALTTICTRFRNAKIRVFAYADGLKGEYSLDFITKLDPESIVFFGWVYDKGLPEKPRYDVISLRDILSSLKRFQHARYDQSQFNNDDLVIILRYWGTGIYETKPGLNPATAMMRSFELPDPLPSRVFVKPDPRVSEELLQDFSRVCAEYTKQDPTDLSEAVAHGGNGTSLPIELLIGEKSGMNYYSFDSSVVVYLAAIGETKLILPSAQKLNEFFVEKRASSLILSYSSIFRRVCEYISNEGLDLPPVVHRHPSMKAYPHLVLLV